MNPKLLNILQRLGVLLFGIIGIYLALWKFFPFFENRAPVSVALFATYIFTAYIFLPSIIRLFRIFYSPKHLPLYCVTPDGFPSDPINVGLIGSRSQIIRSMQSAGWSMADNKNLKSSLKLIIYTLIRKSYKSAPFSSLFLFGRKQDLGFQIQTSKGSSNRHHVRFWACSTDDPDNFEAQIKFWHRFHKPQPHPKGKILWLGAASKDIGIKPIRHNFQLTHMIHPNTDAEREMIVNSLRAAHQVKKTRTKRVGLPLVLRNRVIGGFLKTDGKIRICVLKD